jgi:hypothetical protein
MIRAVVFDVGETLVAGQRLRERRADWLGVRPERFNGTLAEAVRRGEHHRRVFEVFRRGFDYRRSRTASPELLTPTELCTT